MNLDLNLKAMKPVSEPIYRKIVNLGSFDLQFCFSLPAQSCVCVGQGCLGHDLFINPAVNHERLWYTLCFISANLSMCHFPF